MDTNKSFIIENKGGERGRLTNLVVIASFILLFGLSFISAKLTNEVVSTGTGTTNNYYNNTYTNGTDTFAGNYSYVAFLNKPNTFEYPLDIGMNNITAGGLLIHSIHPQSTLVVYDGINVIGDVNFSGLLYGDGSQLTNLPEGVTQTYVNEQNASQTNWVDSTFTKISNLVSYVGNWTEDKMNYYLKTEVDTINTSVNNYIASNNQSVNNYILYVNSTNGAGGTSGGLTQWVNTTNILYTNTVTNVPTHLIGLNTTLLSNSWYRFDCQLTFATNVTTNGLRIGMSTTQTPLAINYLGRIGGQATAGTDSIFEDVGNLKFYNITSTTNTPVGKNETAFLIGDIYTNANPTGINPYFASENNTRLSNVTRGNCLWVKLI